jgi:hypothetical protein
MKIVITHTDFRLYWPARLRGLDQHLSRRGDHLYIIEIAGQGSPYAFAQETLNKSKFNNWECLLPESRLEEFPIARAAYILYQRLEEIFPDIVLAGAIAYPSGAIAVRWCKENGRPVIIFDNARLQDVPRSWTVNWVKRIIYRNVDAVISPGPSQAGNFEFWGVPKERIFLV